ncbi:hypothetical protein BGZ95_007132, partial [Linnemannia exigua]
STLQYNSFAYDFPSPQRASAVPPTGNLIVQQRQMSRRAAPISTKTEFAFAPRPTFTHPPPPPPASPVAYPKTLQPGTKYPAGPTLLALKPMLSNFSSTGQSLPAYGGNTAVAAPLSRQRAPGPDNTSDGSSAGQQQPDLNMLSAFPLGSDATVVDYSSKAWNSPDPQPKSADTLLSLPAQLPTFGGLGSAVPSSQSAFGGFGSTASASTQPTFGGFGSTAPSAQSKKRGFGSPARDIDDGQLPPLETLIDLQTFSGFWEATSELATVVGISLKLLKTEGAALGYNTDEELRILATALAISYFENTLTKDCDSWELVVDKAKGWLLAALQGNQDNLDELFAKAAGLFP